MFDLLEEKDRNNATETLVRLLHDNRDHLNTGFVGTPYLCHVLSGFGHHDLACKLLLHTDLPSWLYPVTKGATTIWEHWDGIREDGSFWDDIMNSFNHYSYGSIGDWMYQEIAGIQVDEKIPGYRHILLRPRLANGMCFARAVYESPYGQIVSGWKRNETEIEIAISIPANSLRQSHCQRHGFHNCGAKAAEKKLLPLLRGQCRQKTAWRLNLAPEIIFFSMRWTQRYDIGKNEEMLC